MTENVYTDEVVKDLSEAYAAAQTPMERDSVVDAWAAKLGVTTPSVRGKLIALGVYVAKTKAKTSSNSMSKDELASAIRVFAGVGSKQLLTLTKMTKNDLETLLEALRQIALLFEVEKSDKLQ